MSLHRWSASTVRRHCSGHCDVHVVKVGNVPTMPSNVRYRSFRHKVLSGYPCRPLEHIFLVIVVRKTTSLVQDLGISDRPMLAINHISVSH